MSTILLSVLLACAPETQEHASAFQINDLGDGIGGPKALARAGDYIIENDKMRFAILGARNSFGPGIYGGSLIDADVVRPGLEYRNGHGNDRFVELNPTVNLDISMVTEDAQIQIIDTDDGSAVIRVSALGKPYLGFWFLCVESPRAKSRLWQLSRIIFFGRESPGSPFGPLRRLFPRAAGWRG
jgi:hypothetical protein